MGLTPNQRHADTTQRYKRASECDSKACSYTSALCSGLPGGALQYCPHFMRYFCPLASDQVWLLTTTTCLIVYCSSTIGEGSAHLMVLVAGSTGRPSEGDLGSG